MTHQARVDYTINGNRIELSNDPTDGRYSLGLHVKASDPSERSALAYASVVFTGHWVEIGGGYSGAAARCMREILRVIEDERIATIKEPRDLPPLPPPDHPPLEHLLDFAYNVITTSQRPERIERLLNDATLAYGGILQSALESQDVLERWLADRHT